MAPGALTPAVAEALRAAPERIVITGAGGWLGLATLELLHQALGDTLAGRVHALGSAQRILALVDGTRVEQRPLAELPRLSREPTLLLHLAFLTRDRAETMAHDDYVRANRAVSALVREALDPIGTTALFVASSGAAALADDPSQSPATRLYGRLKRDDEQLFAAWASAAGTTAIIARIFNLSGPHINKPGNYALASFILDALAQRPIAIRSPHPVIRSYVAIRELMSLVFALLLGPAGAVTRFDSGGTAMELDEVARAVAALFGGTIVRPLPAPQAADHYVGDPARYRDLLGQYGIDPVPFPNQLVETAAFLAAGRPR